jgi:hypothetical protein
MEKLRRNMKVPITFTEGYARVKVGSDWMFIDSTGAFLSDLKILQRPFRSKITWPGLK